MDYVIVLFIGGWICFRFVYPYLGRLIRDWDKKHFHKGKKSTYKNYIQEEDWEREKDVFGGLKEVEQRMIEMGFESANDDEERAKEKRAMIREQLAALKQQFIDAGIDIEDKA